MVRDLPTKLKASVIHPMSAIYLTPPVSPVCGKWSAILVKPAAKQHQCANGKSHGHLPCPEMVWACGLGFSSIAPSSGGAGLGLLRSTALRYPGS